MILNTLDGKTIYYETYGERGNPAIILIHGIGADHKMFAPQTKTFSQEGYFVIVPDMRGHGKSSKVSSLELEDWVSDIKELMDQYKIEKSSLLGVSMGGVIVQKFVTQYPNRVEKLIISDSFGEIKTFLEKTLGFAQVIGFRLFNYLPRKMASNLLASTYKNLSKEATEYFINVTLHADFNQLVLARKAINKIDILSELRSIEIPSLVIVGDKVDLMIGINRKIFNSLQNSSFKVLNGSLDPSNLVVPEEFNQEVISFLANSK